MTYSLRHTCVLIISIIAMLMLSYVSSMPMMSNNSLSIQASQTLSHHVSMAKSEMEANQHTVLGCHSAEDLTAMSSDDSHCDNSNALSDDCCKSVCSVAFYPLASARLISTTNSALALHSSIKIGVKVTRIRNILRPPSA